MCVRFQEDNRLDLNSIVIPFLSIMHGRIIIIFSYYFLRFTIIEYNNHCELLAYNELAIAYKIFNFIFVIIHMHEMRLRLKRFIHMSP